MADRLLLAVGLILLTYAAYRGLSWLFLQRRARLGLGLDSLEPGKPAVLYFTTPDCVPCRTVQRPALESLREQFGPQLQIITIDASQRPEMADSWGVLSVPTTFIIDAQGRPRGVNHGVARMKKLSKQLQRVEPNLEPIAVSNESEVQHEHTQTFQ